MNFLLALRCVLQLKQNVGLRIESETLLLHYSIPDLLISQAFDNSLELVIEIGMSFVLTTSITFVITVLTLCDCLYLLQS